MTTLFDYLTWRGDLTLEKAPFCAVDGLILNCLSYLPFDGVLKRAPRSVAAAAKGVFALPEERRRGCMPDHLKLLARLGESPRFARMGLCSYVNRVDASEEKQFAALTVETGDGALYLAFRGTDNTIVGWKEDFNMSYLETVPSQREAAKYLAEAAAKRGEKLRLGGHSKGGNVAVYAAATAAPAVQKRILGVYNNDGPGFCGDLLESAGYRAISGRVHTYLPQSSMVGMLFSHEEDYTVVHSGQMGVMQHDPYSWEVLGADFVTLEKVTASSRFVDKTIKEWVARMSVPEREKLFDTLYSVLGATGAETWEELSERWFRSARVVLQKCGELDGESRKMIGRMISGLLRASTSGLRELLPGRGEGR